jgi:hypothetical protein
MLPAAQDRPKSVAPAWHTILFVAVVLLFAALAARSQEAMVAAHGRVPMYLMTMAWEWLLVGYILWGARKRGARLRDVSGGKWSTPEEVLIDMAVAVGFWLVSVLILGGVSYALGLGRPDQIAAAKRQIFPLLPQSRQEIGLWLALSATAGFCEELMFRGYLQKQFAAASGSSVLAVLLQAVVFGAGHAYQGGRRMILIAIYGAMFGILAAMRKSVRPGMIAHAMQDSLSGLAFRFLK